MAKFNKDVEIENEPYVETLLTVLAAFQRGDFSVRVPSDWIGMYGDVADTLNKAIATAEEFANDFSHVITAVGKEGNLGARLAVAAELQGSWGELAGSTNNLLGNLFNPLADRLAIIEGLARGDLTRRMPLEYQGKQLQGLSLKSAEAINILLERISAICFEISRVAREVGTEGKLGGQATVDAVEGIWKELTDNVNVMASSLAAQVHAIAEVTAAVAGGDLSHKITVDAHGEFKQIKDTINSKVDHLNSFASEVSRVAREVGMDGKLGGQANVPGVAGTWKDLTDNVNSMATNLTDQVRGIAQVVTAVANGDLSKKVTVDVKGEIADLAGIINSMTETLALFADQVTRVAREVGMDGKLGGQANVPGVAGTWKDLTDNVNSMATNLTDQVRAIAGVATAVTKGDLTRSVTVEAKGEVAELKDNVNEMIRNLRETTNRNSEQDWLKTNLAKFTRILQGQRDYSTVSKAVLSDLAPLVDAHYGAFYIMEEVVNKEACLKLLSAYAYKESKNLAKEWKIGEGLVGQCAHEKRRIVITDVPGDYVEITSGLGRAKPLSILIQPVIFEDKVKAIIELASFKEFSPIHQTFLDQLAESIGIVLNIIEADMRTDELLKQSQSLTNALQSQQEELRQTNDELEDKARLLEEQKLEVELKNFEVEQAKTAVEEKATQLTLTSKYKSEFLSNMSHELRTPLNSLLILAEYLAENSKNHLDAKEVEFAKLIHVSGNDLLALINEILDLSKIESGTVTLDMEEVAFAGLQDQIENTFHHLAKDRGLDFEIILASDLPSFIITDGMRLLQVMKNLLSNAFKFTEQGRVLVRVDRATIGWSVENESLNKTDEVFAFTVEDTGIGISADKQRVIFEAFQQGDGTTARKYGGTGLGLSISRELAQLLGGELVLAHSKPKHGSTFVLYLPQNRINGGVPKSTSVSELILPSEYKFHLPVLGRADESDLKQGILQSTNNLTGKKVLIVDDDGRNIVALAAALERKGMVVLAVDNGGSAIDILKENPDLSLVLMDIMMPEMDGYETMREIRKLAKFKELPIIALTAKAMVGDREKCLEAGASDYLSKPVNVEQLASLMQVWLSK